jgi:hypothetical protein
MAYSCLAADKISLRTSDRGSVFSFCGLYSSFSYAVGFKILEQRMVGRLMKDELERIWKEVAVA